MEESVRVIYTSAPEAYDYESTVIEWQPMFFSFYRSYSRGVTYQEAVEWGKMWRRVSLTEQDNGYYANYQIGRYNSGMYPTFSESEWMELASLEIIW